MMVKEWWERWVVEVSNKDRPTVVAASEFKLLGKRLAKGVLIGKDRRLYRQTDGPIQAIIPLEPKFESSPHVYYGKIIDRFLPPIEELKWLYDSFLKQYNWEVMFVWGLRRNGGGHVYAVPPQVGTKTHIDWNWDGKVSQDEFAKEATFGGTVHIHPQDSASPSDTDLDDWQDPVKGGVHFIFDQNGRYTVTGSVGGYVLPEIRTGSLEEAGYSEICVLRTYGVPLVELCREPKKVERQEKAFVDGLGFSSGLPQRLDRQVADGAEWLLHLAECEGLVHSVSHVDGQLFYIKGSERYWFASKDTVLALKRQIARECGLQAAIDLPTGLLP